MKTRIKSAIVGLAALVLSSCNTDRYNKLQTLEYNTQVTCIIELEHPKDLKNPSLFQGYLCFELTGDGNIDQVIAYRWHYDEILSIPRIACLQKTAYDNYVAEGVPDSLLLIVGNETALPDSMRARFSELLKQN